MKPIVVSLVILGAAVAALRRFGPALKDGAHEKCMEMFQRYSAASPPCQPGSESPCGCEQPESGPPKPQAELSPCGSA